MPDLCGHLCRQGLLWGEQLNFQDAGLAAIRAAAQADNVPVLQENRFPAGDNLAVEKCPVAAGHIDQEDAAVVPFDHAVLLADPLIVLRQIHFALVAAAHQSLVT